MFRYTDAIEAWQERETICCKHVKVSFDMFDIPKILEMRQFWRIINILKNILHYHATID